jgi:4-hydroxy-3-methylbut-2-enyl diphosphate reductase
MENIKIAKVCGLCAGCHFAINVAIDEINKGNSVTIFKEIVHNNNVNNYLTSYGAKFEDDINNLDCSNTIIIRAHGEPPSAYTLLESKNIPYRDCTCHNVKTIHTLVKEFSNNGYRVVVIGKSKHPEVIGTIGWANNAIVIENEDDLQKLNNIINSKLYIVCQTTFNMQKADVLIKKVQTILQQNNCEVIINKSICSAQKTINEYSVQLAQESDVMIVVGGANSSNSMELYNNVNTICPSVFIEDIHTYKDALKAKGLTITPATRVGITAGASTMKSELYELKKLIEDNIK